VRGTQSFVGVMGAVWRRPSLTGLEIAWRWLAGGLLLMVLAPVLLGSLGMDVHLMGVSGTASAPAISGLRGVTVFQPVAAIQSIDAIVAALLDPSLPFLWRMVPIAIVAWLLIATLGRTLVLRRLDPTLKGRRLALFLLGALRAVVLAAVWAVWIWGIRWAARVSILGPSTRGEEPSLVFFCALVICGTLALYVVWAVVSWPLQLAPLLAMRDDLGPVYALREALHAGPVRGKLIEINLVMQIVRIALIVLAMVFSASPLPFSSVATQTFLTCWWTGVVLLYLAMSDYFHVVRAAAYLTLWRAYHA
jgi:hypothetical protein